MAKIRVESELDGESFDFELTDEQLALWQAHAAAHEQTLSESFNEIIADFIASHPIIATRTPQ